MRRTPYPATKTAPTSTLASSMNTPPIRTFLIQSGSSGTNRKPRARSTPPAGAGPGPGVVLMAG